MDIDIEKLIKAAAEGLDLSNFKGDVVGFKYVENEIGNVAEGAVGVQKIYNSAPPSPETPTPQPQEQSQPTDDPDTIIPEGKDPHVRFFLDGMKLVQSKFYGDEFSTEKAIDNIYDWCAAWKLGDELGIFPRFEDFRDAMRKKEKDFRDIPKERQNLSSYRSKIKKGTFYPKWEPLYGSYDKYVRKFKFIADIIYNEYARECKENNIVPYSFKTEE